MRLTCPNCKAQYEVEDSVIPGGGRDVQCSACGTTWFQYPAEVALQMRAADLEDDDEDGPPAPRSPERQVDHTVLEVLRQEAQREMEERKRSQPPVETQADLGLVGRPRPRPRAAGPGTPAPTPRPPAEGTPRRNLLPDIEEVTTTLEPRETRDEREPQADPPADPQRGRDFRRGLSAVLLIGTVLVGLYALAPTLADMVPALAGPLSGYVAIVDSLRQAVSGLISGG